MKPIQELLQERKQRGYAIAKSKAQSIVQKGGVWLVPSATSSNKTYEVRLTIEGARCNCEDFVGRGIRCKHAFALDYILTKTLNKDGTITETTTIKKTYPQMWREYTASQVNEGRLFKELLKDLIGNIQEPIQEGAGRPRVPLKEAIYCAVDKVYSMQSSRRARSRYVEAQNVGNITKAPSYNVVNITLNNAEITPILHKLLSTTALPLKSIETKFSPDSTGFRTSQFSDYCEKKHNTKKQHKWIKCHAITGNTTNIIVSAVITDENGADSPQFIPLVNETADLGFNMEEVSADKAYNSIDNYNAVQQVGGTAYIPYKSNTTALSNTGNRARLWRKMFHYFQLNQDEFLQHYHNRSNVEATFHAIKAKLGDAVKSKNYVAQANEVLCKLIAYNITVLISAMYELKIEPNLICSEIIGSAHKLDL